MRILLYFLIATLGLIFWAKGFWGFCADNHASAGAGLKLWLYKDFWPGPNRWEAKRQQLLQLLGTTGCLLYMAIAILRITYIPMPDAVVLILGRRAAFILLLFSLSLLTRCTLRQYITAMLFLVPFVLEYLKSKDSAMLLCALCLLCCAQLNLRFFLKCYIILLAAIFSVCAVLSRCGVIDGWVKYRDSSVGTFDGVKTPRYAMGFMHSNSTGLVLVLLLIGFILLRGGRLRWWDWPIGAIALLLTYKVIDSRGAVLLLIAFFAALQMLQSFPKLLKIKVMQLLLCTIPIFCAAISFAGAYFYDPLNPFWAAINRYSSTRLMCFSEALQTHEFTWLGQKFDPQFTLPLDNVYLHIYISAGALLLGLFLIGTSLLLYRLAVLKAVPELALTIAMCVYCMLESYARWPYFNPSMWMLGWFMWGIRSKQYSLICQHGNR